MPSRSRASRAHSGRIRGCHSTHHSLRADASTAGLADRIELDAEGGVVRLAGVVDDIDDEDAILGVVEAVPGVRIVDSRITVAVPENAPADAS